MNKLFLLALTCVGLYVSAFTVGALAADEKKSIPIPEPAAYKLLYLDANAHLMIVQYGKLKEEFEKRKEEIEKQFKENQKDLAATVDAVYQQAGVTSQTYTLDLQSKSLVKKEDPPAPSTKVQPDEKK